MSETVTNGQTKEASRDIERYMLQWINAFKAQLSVRESEMSYPLDRTHFEERKEIGREIDSLAAMIAEFSGGEAYSSQKHGVEQLSFGVLGSSEDLGITHTVTSCYLQSSSFSGRLPIDVYREQISYRACEMVKDRQGHSYEDAINAEIEKTVTNYSEGQRGRSAEKAIALKTAASEKLTALLGVHLSEYEFANNGIKWSEERNGVVVRKNAGIKVVFYPRGRIAVFAVVYPGGQPALLEKPLAEYKRVFGDSDENSDYMNILKLIDQFATRVDSAVEKSKTSFHRRRL